MDNGSEKVPDGGDAVMFCTNYPGISILGQVSALPCSNKLSYDSIQGCPNKIIRLIGAGRSRGDH